MALNFKKSGSISAGDYSANSARQEFSKISSSLGLADKARAHFIQALEKGGNITGREFNQIVDDACQEGLIDGDKAEKIKDAVNLPDNYNKHWQ